MVALDLGVCFGGVLMIQEVLGWPGLELAWEGRQQQRHPGDQLDLLADLLNGAVDPRDEYG